MPQVPYSPAQTQESHLSPTPSIHVDTSPDMFGEALGRAIGQEGQITSQASDEVFQRAQAMQQLNNEAGARDAQVQYMQKQGELHADFTSKQGADAGPDALNNYMKASNDLRLQSRDALASPAAQKLFDNDSMTFMSRNIFNAAGHSAQQMKGYSLATSQGLLDNNANTALQSPQDELQFKAGLDNQKTWATQHAADMGYPPGSPAAQDFVDKQVSNMVSQRILGAARTDPTQANDWYQAALKDGTLRGQDITKVQNTIQSSTASILPKQISDGINNGSSLVLGQKAVPIEQAQAGIKAAESNGGDYSARGPVVKTGAYAGQQGMGAYMVMPGNLAPWLKEAGMAPMTPDQFMASKEAQDQLFTSRFGGYMEKYGSFNRAASAWFTGNPDAPPSANDGHNTVPQYLATANAGLAKVASISDKVEAGRGEAERVAGSAVPGIGDATAAHIETRERQDQFLSKQQTAQTWNTIDGVLAGSQGHTIGSLDQLRQDPQAAQALDSLKPNELKTVLNKIRVNQANDNIQSPERDQNRQSLVGLMSGSPEDIDKFQHTDMYSQDLTNNDRKTLIGLQQKQIKGAVDDPNLSRAVRNLLPQTDAAGLTGESADKAQMNVFRGALTEQIQDFQKTNTRPPSIDEMQTMGRRLLQNTVVGKKWFGIADDNEPVYSAKPDDTQAARIRSLAPNTDMSDTQVQRVYTRMLYNQVMKKERSPNG